MVENQTSAESSRTTIKCIEVKAPGGPEAMQLVHIPRPTPGSKQALVRIAVSGVNFTDVAFRTGLIKSDLPVTLGLEGSGTVEAVGPDVSEVIPGDRVVYAMSRGSYAEYAVVPAAQLVKIPGSIDLSAAAAVMLQGMTAHYLTHSTYPVKRGETCLQPISKPPFGWSNLLILNGPKGVLKPVLVHAAAGGVGSMIVQIAKMLGARVLGTVSTKEKAHAAREFGVDEAILYTEGDFEAEVKRFTNGSGVDVVYDSVGKSTFEKSLNCLRIRGMLVLFGQTSGPIPPMDPAILSGKGSLFLTRPSLTHYIRTREELLMRAGDVLNWVASGKVKPCIYRTYPLSEAAAALRELENRRTVGKLLLRVP